MKPERRRLYEYATYAKTDRLKKLISGELSTTERDIRELFSEYAGGCREYGSPVVLSEFADWLLTGQLKPPSPCEIFW